MILFKVSFCFFSSILLAHGSMKAFEDDEVKCLIFFAVFLPGPTALSCVSLDNTWGGKRPWKYKKKIYEKDFTLLHCFWTNSNSCWQLKKTMKNVLFRNYHYISRFMYISLLWLSLSQDICMRMRSFFPVFCWLWLSHRFGSGCLDKTSGITCVFSMLAKLLDSQRGQGGGSLCLVPAASEVQSLLQFPEVE